MAFGTDRNLQRLTKYSKILYLSNSSSTTEYKYTVSQKSYFFLYISKSRGIKINIIPNVLIFNHLYLNKH